MSILSNSRILRDPYFGFDSGPPTKGDLFRIGFLQAVRAGKISRVKKILRQGVWLDKNSALSVAAGAGKKDMVLLLLEQGASIDVGGCYALCDAIHYDHLDMVRLLLEKGADVHASDDHALVVAVLYKKGSAADILLRHIFRAEAWQDKQPAELEAEKDRLCARFSNLRPQITAIAGEARAARDKAVQDLFCAAVERGDAGQTEDLLSRGGIGEILKEAAFCHAAQYGLLDVVKVLLGDCADFTEANMNMALGHAIEREHEGVVSLLLERGLKIDAEKAFLRACSIYQGALDSGNPPPACYAIIETLVAHIFRPIAWQDKNLDAVDGKYHELVEAAQSVSEVNYILETYALRLKETLDPLYDIKQLADQQAQRTPEQRERDVQELETVELAALCGDPQAQAALTAIPLPRLCP